MKPSTRTILVESLRDFRRTWPQLIIADLIARILAVVVLTPLVGLLLKVFLATTATGVVTDGAVVDFLLHPTGLVTTKRQRNISPEYSAPARPGRPDATVASPLMRCIAL